MSTDADLVSLWGSAELEPRQEDVTVGPWSLAIRGSELADIRFGGELLLRALRVVVRDQDWNTIPPETEYAVEPRRDGARISFRVRHRGRGVDFAWTGVAELSVSGTGGDVGGTEGGMLGFRFEGEALSDFLRARIGIIALHPIDDAGREFTVLSPSGDRRSLRLPVDIAPHQPARDIAGLRWRRGDVEADLRFEGDVFEMEDQRNWTDASFKTYSTPLDLPFPVQVRAGDRVAQSVTLDVRSAVILPDGATGAGRPESKSRDGHPGSGPIVIDSAARPAQVPAIGVGATPVPPAGASAEGDAPGAGSFVLLEVDVTDPGAADRVSDALTEAGALGGRGERSALDVRLTARSDLPQLGGLLDAVLAPIAGHPPLRIGIFSATDHVTTPELLVALLAALDRAGLDPADGGAALVGGARSHFTELNRRFADLPPELPALAFSITAQMHTVETEHVTDTIAAQRIVAENAVRLAGARPVHIGPVTLKQRFNAVATGAGGGGGGTAAATEPDPATVDVRQSSAYAAAWTVASIAALSIPGVSSLCYFEQAGPRGLRAWSGEPYPVRQVVAALSALAGCPVLGVSAVPEGITVLAVLDGTTVRVFVANLGPVVRSLTLRVDGADPVPITVGPAGVETVDLPTG